jgi:pteridine reductase
MNKSDNEKQNPVALITGGARRIGATIAQTLHSNGYNIVLHYRQSVSEAQTLVNRFNQGRDNSAVAIAADLHQLE